jgi:Flp pilus assembly protein TadD
VPADPQQNLQEFQMQPGPGQEVGCLLEMVKSHYHKTGPRLTESQRAEQTKRLLASLPEGTSLSEQMLRMATELQLVETIPVSPMGPATDFVGVNMYVDDQAQAKGLPLNPRASSILSTCRCAHQVFGDAFIARLQDNEAADVFKRMDFRLSELNSSSEWIRQAQRLNDPKGQRAQAGGRGSPASVGGVGAGGGGQKKAAPPAAKGAGGGPAAETTAPPDPAARAERAELEKLVGNRLFKQGRYEKAVEHYSRAIEGGEGAKVRVYLNNRAAALLKLGKGAEAEADCDRILAEEPGNAKALFRRGTSRRAQGRVQDAILDFEHCLKVDPKSAEAKSHIEELRAALSGHGGGGASAGGS